MYNLLFDSPCLLCVLVALLGMLYEDKERLDFVYTIYHWWQAIAIFIVHLWYFLPMRVKMCVCMHLCVSVGKGSAGYALKN